MLPLVVPEITVDPPPRSQTIAVLGCGQSPLLSWFAASIITYVSLGRMGSSMIRGILKSELVSVPRREERSNFLACVTRKESADDLQDSFGAMEGITVLINENILAATQADIIILACKPYALADVLGQSGMKEAVGNKSLISILAGKMETEVEEALYGPPPTMIPLHPHVLCAIPNMASAVGQSVTVVSKTAWGRLLPATRRDMSIVLNGIGRVFAVPDPSLEIGTVVCASGPAYMTLVVDTLVTALMARGIGSEDSTRLAASVMKGVAHLLLEGWTTKDIRSRVATPGGITAMGLNLLDNSHFSKILADAIRAAELHLQASSRSKP